MATISDSSRIIVRQQESYLLSAAIDKTLLQADKAQLFAHHRGCDEMKGLLLNTIYSIRCLSSKNVRQTFQGIRPQYTTRNRSSRLNRQRGFSVNHILANGWNEEYLQDNVCTPARCQGRSSVLQAPAPS